MKVTMQEALCKVITLKVDMEDRVKEDGSRTLWSKKTFRTDLKGFEISVGGVFALLPYDDVLFVAMRVTNAPFTCKGMEEVTEMYLRKGWYPGPWKDDGLKDPKGVYKFYPFFRGGFNLMSYLTSQFGWDYSKSYTVDKMVKMAKYFSQPVDFDCVTIVKVLTVPAKLWYADGPGVSKYAIFKSTGLYNKVVGYGKGVFYKGMVLTSTSLKHAVPKKVLDAINKKNLGMWDIVCTTDTLKFSKPWKVYEIVMCWHDDSSRNVHSKCTISEQFIRVADTTNDFKAWYVDELNKKAKFASMAFGTKGRLLGKFIKGVAGDRDFDRDSADLNMIMGDVGDLLLAGVPYAWNGIARNVKKSIQNLIRSIMVMKYDGGFAKVFVNANLNRGTVIVPGWMRRFGVKIGDVITVWRSPISPTSVHLYKVVGFTRKSHADIYNKNKDTGKEEIVLGKDGKPIRICDNHIEMNGSDLNEFHQGDGDGDGLSFAPVPLINGNRDRLDDPVIDSWTKEFEKKVKSFEFELDKGKGKKGWIKELINEIYITDLSKAVGFAERGRAAMEIKHGKKIWKAAYAYFQAIEQQLINMKKHGGRAWDPIAAIQDMIGKMIPIRPNFHRLLCNRRPKGLDTGSKSQQDQAITDYIDKLRRLSNNPRFDGCEHEFMFAYKKATGIAGTMLSNIEVTPRDMQALYTFKDKLCKYARRLMAGPSGDNIKTKIMDVNFQPVGLIQKLKEEMGAFYGGANKNDPLYAKVKEEFRRGQKEYMLQAKGDTRKAAICCILINEIYAWSDVYNFKDVSAVIEKSGV